MKTVDKKHITKVIGALIDTARRTTDLEYVYNDSTGESCSWDEVMEAYYDSITLAIEN